MYAIVKAGGAYVPIDPEHPSDRIAYVLDSAAPQLILTTGAHAAVLPDDVRCIDLDGLVLDGYDDAPVVDADRLRPLRTENTAYVIYTSGSTGRPKGVSVSHAAIVNQLRWLADEYRVTSDDRIMQRAPFTFDVSVWECFLPLAVGAHLVITRPGGTANSTTSRPSCANTASAWPNSCPPCWQRSWPRGRGTRCRRCGTCSPVARS
ncbi:AMP-binding protein [Prescottella defluvii]|nr:AMP-binding protein [Prescottella defluvii]